MIDTLLFWALRRRWIVVLLALGVCGAGLWAFFQQPIDAYPDISGQMVQVITTFPGRAPEEVERQITIPIEIAMRNVPQLTVIRSRTIFGLSVVQMVFEEGTESYWARQRVQEKLSGLTLPQGAEAELGPLATAYGEVFRYELMQDEGADLTTLQELNEWVVIPRLLRASGVAEVTNFGGLTKQFAVTFSPEQLAHYGISLNELVEAVKSNNASAGGSVMPRGSMSFVIRGAGAIENTSQIEGIFVKSIAGTPISVRDVATVSVDAMPPSGIYSKDFKDESVEGIVLMRRGENPSRVLDAVKEAAGELNESGLPEGVRIASFYDREFLVESTLHTVGHSVGLGITLVVIVLLLFLGRPSMAALVAVTIPFSLLFALVLMYLTRIPIGLLSIGAIDFGIIVDGAIIMAENIARRVGEATHEGRLSADIALRTEEVETTIERSASEVARSIFFSVLMIVAAYLPLLSLRSIEGLLFRPMALTMVYALGGALLFALFVLPALARIIYRLGYDEWENPLLKYCRPLYATVVRGMTRMRWITLSAVFAVLAFVGIQIVPNLGIEFLPYMDEGVVWVRANFPEGTSLEQTSAFGRRIREIAKEFQDVKFVSVQAGRNDSGTDPFPPSRLEIMIGPRPEWTEFRSKQELVAAIGARLREEFPTTRFNFTQPIIDSVTEDTNGTSANLAVEFSGTNSETLLELGQAAVDLLRKVPGATDVNIEQEGPQPQLVVIPDRALCARYNIRIEDVTNVINTALGGAPVGMLYEGERRFDIVVRVDRQALSSPQSVAAIPIHSVDGLPVPLGQVAGIELVDGQTLIARENGRRRITVRCDIVGRDQGTFVREAQRQFEATLRKDVPAGYRVAWLGMFENLERAKNHFALVIPITIAIICLLLWMTFRSVKAAILLVASLPFALIGGVVALWWRGMNLNVSTGVGFAALFGVSIMNGVLMVRSIMALQSEGRDRHDAIIQGALECLRPILLASLVAILGLLPASLATGLGSDVQRPLATVIVWGLFSSTILTLFVVPVLYELLAVSPPGANPT